MAKRGGYSGTSSASLNIYELIKTQELALTPDHIKNNRTYFPLVHATLVPEIDCTIKVNDGSSINVDAGVGIELDEHITKLVIVENAIDYQITYKIKI